MGYEDLLIEAQKKGLKVTERPLKYGFKGLYKNGRIIIDKKMRTSEKLCILAEEIGHHETTVGNIINENDIQNKKQEIKARRYGYKLLVEPIDLIYAFNKSAKNKYEIAEILNITESTLEDAIEYFRCRYGVGKQFGEYYIGFEPNLHIIKLFNQ